MNREKLIKEFIDKDIVTIPEFVDFIIADRQRILKPIIEHKKTWHDGEWGCVKFKDAMNAAITLAGLEKEK